MNYKKLIAIPKNGYIESLNPFKKNLNENHQQVLGSTAKHKSNNHKTFGFCKDLEKAGRKKLSICEGNTENSVKLNLYLRWEFGELRAN